MAAGVLLREVRREDLPVFFAHQRDPVAARMAAFPAREHADFLAAWERSLADASIVKRTIVSGGKVAGHVVAWEQDGRWLFGYWLGREHWGHGVASEAVALFLVEAGARPLFAHVARHNVASVRVLEKAGFVAASDAEVDASMTEPDAAELRMLKLESA